MQLSNNETARILEKDIILKLNPWSFSKNLPPIHHQNFFQEAILEFIPVSISIRQDKNHNTDITVRIPSFCLISGAISSAALHHTYWLYIPAFQHESSWPWTALQSMLVFPPPLESLKPVSKREYIKLTSTLHSIQSLKFEIHADGKRFCCKL